MIPFYYGSGSSSGTEINYGSGSDFLARYGSGSASQKVTVPTVPVSQRWMYHRVQYTGTSVSHPDPDWIQIQSGPWIRIRICNTDPDPGGQKLPKKWKEIRNFKCWMFSFGAEGFFCSLAVLSGGLELGKLQFFIIKMVNFFLQL